MIRSKPVDYYNAVILDINMPIMDGFKACNLIYDYLNQVYQPLSGDKLTKQEQLSLRKSKTLIYCLSSDLSPQTAQDIDSHPFDDKISYLGA